MVTPDRWSNGALTHSLSVLPHGLTIITQLLSHLLFPLLRQLVRKRVEVLVEFREQAAVVPLYEPPRLVATLVLPESLLRCDSSHSDVDSQVPWNPVRVRLGEPFFLLKHFRI